MSSSRDAILVTGDAHLAGGRGWTFLSSHAQVALCLARDSTMRLREVAASVGITERAVQKIVADLEEEGFLERIREGRRNRYVLHYDRPLRHTLGRHRTLGSLITLMTEEVSGK